MFKFSKGAQFKEKIYTDEHCRRLYYKLLCLPLLPKQLILDEFKKIEKDGRSIQSPLMNKFLNYYKNQWLKRVKNHFALINLPHIIIITFGNTIYRKDRIKLRYLV